MKECGHWGMRGGRERDVWFVVGGVVWAWKKKKMHEGGEKMAA